MTARLLLAVALLYFLTTSLLASVPSAAALFRSAGTPCRLPFDIGCTFLGGVHEDPDVRAVSDEVADIEARTLADVRAHPPQGPYRQIVVLGKLELYDKSLSVNKNIACASCHVPQTGFTSGVQLYNRTIVAQPGSEPITNVMGDHPNWRIGDRKPQSYGYAPFSPILHYVATLKQFVGGNFWDLRATGYRLQNPAAEQAQDPPTDPNEMANPDSACVVYALSKAPPAYRALFVRVWGAQSFAIHFPADVARVCSRPASTNEPNPMPVRLSKVDRGTSNSTYEHFADALAAFEASPEISAFSSKFDAVLARKAVFTASEMRGYTLFNGQANCSACHSDTGSAAGVGRTITLGRVTVAQATGPLFTDATSANLGVPRNDDLSYLYEDRPDQFGYVANPAGPTFVDLGVGTFLASELDPNRAEWGRLAPLFDGQVGVPTLRNVDKRPYPTFVKAYFHNGYMKSLKEVVHFYNTRDTLPRCASADAPGVGKTCWPAPEVAQNLSKQIGNLGLSDAQEDDVVAFLKTLTDGYQP